MAAFVLLLLLPCVTAVRQMDVDLQASLAAQEDQDFKTFERAVEEGAEIQSELTCEAIASQMASEVTQANEALSALFNDLALADATMQADVENAAVLAAEEIMALASAADLKKCLPEAMTGSASTQSGIKSLLQTHLTTVLYAPDAYGDASLKLAYTRLVSWMQGMADLAGPDLERTAIFPQDVENNCPSPCGQCFLKHNSWRKGEERFKFKCLLQKGQEPPSENAALTCTDPKRRRSFWRPHRWGRKSWCTVSDWKDLACRQLRVTTALGCGTELIISPMLQHWNESTVDEFASHAYFDCVKWETTLATFGSMHYRYGHAGHRVTVPEWNKLGFRIIMALGLSNGLASLRAGSRAAAPGKIVVEDLLSVFLQDYTVDEYARSIFNGTANAGGRELYNGEIDTQGDITRSCSSLIEDMELCLPSWKGRNENFPIRAWRFGWRLVSVVQSGVVFTATLLLINAGLLATLGLLFGGVGALFVGAGLTYLQIIASVGVVIGSTIGYESFTLKDYGYNPRCSFDEPRGRLTWTDLLEDAKATANSLD